VPLNETVLACLKTLPNFEKQTGPIFVNQRHPDKPVRSNDHWFLKALAKAEIKNFKFHDIRHCYATTLVQLNVPLHRVAKLLGHKSLAMTLRYAHLAPSQLADDVALLDRKQVQISTELAPELLDEKLTAYIVN
jgi:integrase